MAEILPGLVGRHVEVWTVGGSSEHSDEGMLERSDEQCIMLKKHNGDKLVFPLTLVRLVKVKD